MNVPIRFQYLPLDGGSPDLDKLSSLHEDSPGSGGEHYCLLSYFPKKLHLSEENNFVVNKYLVFVKDPELEADYQITWSYQVLKDGVDITNTLIREVVKNAFDFTLTLQYLQAVNNEYWELELKIKCEITKNGTTVETPLTLEQTIQPVDASLLSSSGESFEDESGNNTAVGLGNEETTHFMRGHLSQYLIERKKAISGSDPDSNPNDDNPNNASVFINQVASIVYLNVLRGIQQFSPESDTPGEQEKSSSRFDQIFEVSWLIGAIEGRFPMSGYARLGICSINLQNAIPLFNGEENTRVEYNHEILEFVSQYLEDHKEDFVRVYNLCVFPKSAIELSASIFDDLFKRFKADSSETNMIYQTDKSTESEQRSTIAAWKELAYSEMRETSNDDFMKNVYAEHKLGFFKKVSLLSFQLGNAGRVLKIDWSQFIQKILTPPLPMFSLKDFLSENAHLDQKTNEVFDSLSAHDRVAQMLMPAAEMAYKKDVDDEDNDGKVNDWVADFTRDGPAIREIKTLIRERKIGGVLLLKGTKDQFSEWSQDFRDLNAEIGPLPLLISADAEPTLINDKMRGLPAITKANELTSISEVEDTATQICDIISERGINYNFAPVVDVAQNFVEDRSFGTIPANLLPFSKKFIETVQNRNIIATAKHFPGHGLVVGDTHKPVSGGDDKKIVVIDGEFGELENYPPLIRDGVLSIMIAHIVVRNNEYHTDTLPASLSKAIVTDLLRDQLGFKGLIVTDGLNMGAVTYVPDLAIKAVEAGVDILELLVDTSQSHADILAKYNVDVDFKGKVDQACKRIVRMKICLGLI